MVKSFKGLDDKKIDEELFKIRKLFSYIKDKDVFELYYKKYLSKRLINKKLSSETIEIMLVNELKEECGDFFTKKIEIIELS